MRLLPKFQSELKRHCCTTRFHIKKQPFFPSLQTNSADGACEELAVFEHWSDRTALDSHRSSAHVREFGEKSGELMAAAGAKFDVQEYRSCGI